MVAVWMPAFPACPATVGREMTTEFNTEMVCWKMGMIQAPMKA